MNKKIYLLLALAAQVSNLQAQHIHISAGATSTAQNSKLIFSNSEQFERNSGYVLPLDQGDPLYPGLYQGAATFTALPATIWTGGPVPNHAAQGSYIQAVVESVTGPTNGIWSFWLE